ncbi:hypothetical protein ACLMJK_004770 [Lecanora helva]
MSSEEQWRVAHSPTHSPPPTQRSSFNHTLRMTFGRKWPLIYSSIPNIAQNPASFSVKLDPIYRSLASFGDISQNFTDSMEGLEALFNALFGSNSHHLEQKMDESLWWTALEDAIIDVIFGSNFIEGVGTTREVTAKLCYKVFRGKDVDAEVLEEVAEGVRWLRERGALIGGTEEEEKAVVIRSRREVVQHAKAFEYMVVAMVQRDEMLSERLIKDTHRILCTGNDLDDAEWTQYAGVYRDGEVSHAVAGQKRPHKFITHRAVPRFMKEMIKEYQATIASIESKGELDPFTLAARFCYYFVNIHPFWDGNGRLCRLILNTILLKYAGLVVPIGEDGDEGKEEYLAVCHVSGQEFLAEGFNAASPSGHRRFRAFLMGKAGAIVERLCKFLD